MSTPTTITVTLSQIAKSIDHSLLHPTLTDNEITTGLNLAKSLNVAAACVKPYSVPLAARILSESNVLVCAVIGFPHGNSTTPIKRAEAECALRDGAQEIDMVVNIGKVLSSDWAYITDEIRTINDVVVAHPNNNNNNNNNNNQNHNQKHAILKVIFENDYLDDEHIVQLCKICTAISVAYVKTSTGYGFVKQPSTGARGKVDMYTYQGATLPHLKLMKANVGPTVHVKAAGGIRTLDELLRALAAGATRIGASATETILREAVARGIGTTPVQIAVGDT